MSIQEFVEEHPSSALSICLVQSASNEEQRQLLPLLINNAVFADAWLLYFEFAKNNELMIDDEIVLNAMQLVGLDPYSVKLWILAIEICVSLESKHALYSIALSIPLYNHDKLRDKYNSSKMTEHNDMLEVMNDAQTDKIDSMLLNEKWPNRYADVFINNDERREVKRQWTILIDYMINSICEENNQMIIIPKDVQCRRIKLAFQQMCAQLHDDESCWYQHALFDMSIMKNTESAVNILHRGIEICKNKTFLLHNLLAAISRKEEMINDYISRSDCQCLLSLKQLQAIYDLQKEESENKELIRALRSVGKKAASEGVCEWPLFSQWWKAENLIVSDAKMAAKVLENGLVCCSTELEGRCALNTENTLFHLLHGHDRECVAYGEEQVAIASSVQLQCMQESAENTLARVKRLLGIYTNSELKLRNDKQTSLSELDNFLTRYRVGCFLPCSLEMYNWSTMIHDSEKQKALEKLPSSYNVTSFAQSRVSSQSCEAKTNCSFFDFPDCEQWQPLQLQDINNMSSNSDIHASSNNINEVNISRELLGRWLYRPRTNASTLARIRWEHLQATKQNSTSSSQHSLIKTSDVLITKTDPTSKLAINVSSQFALKKLHDKLCKIQINNLANNDASKLSTLWIIDQLTNRELDLRVSLVRRKKHQENFSLLQRRKQ